MRGAGISTSLPNPAAFTGTNGGGTVATRTTAFTITAGQGLYDVALRLVSDDPGTYGPYSLLDLELKSEDFTGGDAMRIFTNEGGVRSKVAFFDNGGTLYTRVGIVISGTFAN